jgi:membrane-bound inhibitor of C-type lysozyme
MNLATLAAGMFMLTVLPSLAHADCAEHARQLGYQCGHGAGFVARFAPDGASVTVVLPDQTEITLPAQPVGSGFRYADAMHELRGKGGEALWTIGRRVPVRCVAPDAGR